MPSWPKRQREMNHQMNNSELDWNKIIVILAVLALAVAGGDTSALLGLA